MKKLRLVMLSSLLGVALLSGCVSRIQVKKQVEEARQFERASAFDKISTVISLKEQLEKKYDSLSQEYEATLVKLKNAEERALRCK